MRVKNQTRIFGATIGLAGAVAVSYFPHYSAQIEMTLYSAMVLGSLSMGFWSDRHHRRFLTGVSLIAVSHCLLLWALRYAFPFSTILLVVPIALTEGTIMAILMVELLED